MKKLKTLFYEHLIQPIINSVAPVSQVSWGVAIGLFVGLTPTMGIQMYIAALIWAICRYILRFRFNLPVSVAMVWISNPLTVVPLYYLFLVTGYLFFELFNWPHMPLSFEAFRERFNEISSSESSWEVIVEGTRFLLYDLGLPMLTGSMLFAIPIGIGSYFVTVHFLTRYRKYKAKQENISYEEWRLRYETPN